MSIPTDAFGLSVASAAIFCGCTFCDSHPLNLLRLKLVIPLVHGCALRQVWLTLMGELPISDLCAAACLSRFSVSRSSILRDHIVLLFTPLHETWPRSGKMWASAHIFVISFKPLEFWEASCLKKAIHSHLRSLKAPCLGPINSVCMSHQTGIVDLVLINLSRTFG